MADAWQTQRVGYCLGRVGALLVGVFAVPALGGNGFGGEHGTIMAQLSVQGISVLATMVYTALVSYALLKMIDVWLGLRVNEEQEVEGLDHALHDERGYIL